MPKIKFVRDTRATEDVVEHKAGETLDVSDESADRWIRRGAAEVVSSSRSKRASDGKSSQSDAE